MSRKIKLLIADDVADTRENVRKLLMFHEDIEVIGEAADGDETIDKVSKLKPDIVLMDINMPVLDGLAATEMISLKIPQTSVIIMSVQGEHEYMKRAMAAGAKEFIVKPFSGDELAETIYKVYDIEKQRKQKIEHLLNNQSSRDGKILSVFSTKGGVGKTTISTNLAAYYAKRQNKKVALVDLDLQFGDAAVMLNITPLKSMADISSETNDMNWELIKDFFISHSSGLKLLPAPVKPEYAEYITSTHIETLLKNIREHFDLVIIDTPQNFHETVLTALDLSDLVLLVVTMDLPALKNIKMCLDVMESLNYSKRKINLVINKVGGNYGLNAKDVARILKYPVINQIPNDESVVLRSINEGNPFVLTKPKAAVSREISNLAAKLFSKKQQKGIFSKMRR